MKGLEENRWCMGRGGCILWEEEWITGRPAARGLLSGGRVVALGEVRVFEALDLVKAGTYE